MVDDKDTNWWLPAIQACVVRLRLCSYLADDEKADQQQPVAQTAANELQRFFAKMVCARSPA